MTYRSWCRSPGTRARLGNNGNAISPSGPYRVSTIGSPGPSQVTTARVSVMAAYRWETDDELERKRKVYMSFIVGQTRDEILAKSMKLEDNREMYEALSKIIRGREKRKRKWGRFTGGPAFSCPLCSGFWQPTYCQ